MPTFSNFFAMHGGAPFPVQCAVVVMVGIIAWPAIILGFEPMLLLSIRERPYQRLRIAGFFGGISLVLFLGWWVSLGPYYANA